uniref:Uncharacterized protein n=1 Tax=Opuntia streptacantha TaxID=393608 RepID=A0A7C9AQA7_OPUST
MLCIFSHRILVMNLIDHSQAELCIPTPPVRQTSRISNIEVHRQIVYIVPFRKNKYPPFVTTNDKNIRIEFLDIQSGKILNFPSKSRRLRIFCRLILRCIGRLRLCNDFHGLVIVGYFRMRDEHLIIFLIVWSGSHDSHWQRR